MNLSTKVGSVGIVPLVAFFLGAGLMTAGLLWNERAMHAGGWSELSRAVVMLFVVIGATVYVTIFGTAALMQLRKYRALPGTNVTAAKVAVLLYGCAALGLLFVWVSVATS